MEILTPRKSARHQLARAMQLREREASQARVQVAKHFNDGALLLLHRPKPRSVYSSLHHAGPVRHGEEVRPIRCGPNEVHACVFRGDGSVEDLGVSHNLLTNVGRDWWAQQFGFIPAGGSGSPSTAVGATSITATGTPWTASNLATPQLGLAGLRVYPAPHTTTAKPVYGNIVSNTSSVISIDQWWTDLDAVGTTPTVADGFVVLPGGVAAARFVALTTNASAAAAADTALTGEITTGGCGRALGTYAHTYGVSTLTLSKTFTATAGFTAIHKLGLFACLTAAGADPMLYEAVLNADATVASGDTLALTYTVTLSG